MKKLIVLILLVLWIIPSIILSLPAFLYYLTGITMFNKWNTIISKWNKKYIDEPLRKFAFGETYYEN